jgi:hypothetical protein
LENRLDFIQVSRDFFSLPILLTLFSVSLRTHLGSFRKSNLEVLNLVYLTKSSVLRYDYKVILRVIAVLPSLGFVLGRKHMLGDVIVNDTM